MDTLNNVLSWILQIGGTAVIVLGALLWLKAASMNLSTARSFIALVFTFVFFIAVVLRPETLKPATVRWLVIVYGFVAACYIMARMIEHREEIRKDRQKKETSTG